MAADVYLNIEGIKGESRDAGHKDWMECSYVDFGVYQPATPGGRTVARCCHDTIIVTKGGDLASPILMQTCCMGKTLPRATIEVMRANGDKPFRYFVIELEHVLIAEVAPEVSEGQLMIEHVALAFGKVRWHYAKQSIAGTLVGNTIGGWDLTQNARWA